MTSKAFPLNQSQISKCVKEIERNQAQSSTSLAHEQCEILYRKHQTFYKRSFTHSNTPGRFQLFTTNVEFVHNHHEDAESSHHVTLNQFSDLFQNELPFETTSSHDNDLLLVEEASKDESKTEDKHHNNQFTVQVTDNLETFQSMQKISGFKDPSLVLYNPTKLPGHTQSKAKNQQHNKWIVYEHSKHPYALLGQVKGCNITNCGGRLDYNSKHEKYVYDFNPSDDNWSSNLDWATENNPDGVAIVHPPSDQGTCGSCWSFAAIGSLESNIARNTAADLFYNEMPSNIQSMSSSWKHNDTAIASLEIHNAIPQNQLNLAVHRAQKIERKAHSLAKLSIQELIDCDTKHNQGCIGGNPVLAFPYIHKHGLVSSFDYPYDGVQNKKCLKDNLEPIATTDSWGVLRAKDEASMEFAVRHLGPISVGFNGGDKSFLLYSGGIFDSEVCSNHPNHAMLITGYGEEKDVSGKMVKYWIARNSWGTGWGDKGYIKVKRKEKLKSSGVCAIAKNPSIAVGGYLINVDNRLMWQEEESITTPLNQSKYIRSGVLSPASTSITRGNNALNTSNQGNINLYIPSVFIFALFGMVFLISAGKFLWSIKVMKIRSSRTSSNDLCGDANDSVEETEILRDVSVQTYYGSMYQYK